jgi:proteasome lid subunit RPN8/RPN11
MKCRISRFLLDSIADRCAARPTLESCGLLLGEEGEILAAVDVPNRAADPARRFELDSAAHLATSRAARGAGMRIIGHYHWHPSGSAMPSTDDRLAADRDGVYWLILAATDRRLWISRRGGSLEGAFDPVALSLCKALPCQQEGLGPIGGTGNIDGSAGAISA